MSASNYLENELLKQALGGPGGEGTFTQPTTLYLALFTEDLGGDPRFELEAGTLTSELSGNGYARVSTDTQGSSIAFFQDTPGSWINGEVIEFAAATGNWNSISHIAIMDAATAGNVLFVSELDAAVTIQTGDIFRIPDGGFTVSMD